MDNKVLQSGDRSKANNRNHYISACLCPSVLSFFHPILVNGLLAILFLALSLNYPCVVFIQQPWLSSTGLCLARFLPFFKSRNHYCGAIMQNKIKIEQIQGLFKNTQQGEENNVYIQSRWKVGNRKFGKNHFVVLTICPF